MFPHHCKYSTFLVDAQTHCNAMKQSIESCLLKGRKEDIYKTYIYGKSSALM